MCCYCCISLRGAVYFGTSIHIFVGLMLFLRWVVVTYIDGFVTQKILEEASVLISTVLSGMYVVFFITLGCLIFAGTERESVSLLKWSASGFTMLQILAFTVLLILYLVAPEGWPFLIGSFSYEMKIMSIAMYFFSLVATLNYLVVLFLYIRKLWNLKGSSTRSSSSLNNIRISHPIPQQTSTLSTSGTLARDPSNSYAVSYHNHHHNNGGSRRGQIQGPESPGIYESLDTQSLSSQAPHVHQHQHPHPFYPANFYASYNARNRLEAQQQQQQQEAIYNASQGSRSGLYSQRPYPYPHQRYREPLAPVRGEEEPPQQQGQQEWVQGPNSNYAQRVQIFQRGHHDRSSGTAEPLLRHPQNY